MSSSSPPSTADVAPQNATNVTTQHAGSGWQAQALNLFADWDYLALNAKITLSAMAIIYLGAHSSLRRPPSAAPAKRPGGDKKKGRRRSDAEEDGFAEGFVASDAIMFPVLAGTVLVGLYYLIRWLQDPDLLNKILRAYMSIVSVASLSRLGAHVLQFVTGLVFPSVWMDRTGKLYKIDTVRRRQLLCPREGTEGAAVVSEKKSPFPGFLSSLPLSDRTNRVLWAIRHLLMEEWTVRLSVHGFGSTKAKVGLNDMLGFLLAIVTILAYYATSWPVISNLLGTAMCYASFSLMSPTTFFIGTLVLVGLFFYDIVMVFYTPYMITVATKLDAPIKLVFGSPSRPSILGLGDIVIPGIFIAFALRFDLWRYYKKQIKYVPTELRSEFVVGDAGQQKSVTTTTDTQFRAVKAPFVDPRGQWGNRLWTMRLRELLRPTAATAPTPALATAAFPKTYFHAAMVGYAFGMLATTAMMLVFRHGQPALLYLVPCVTGSVWATGATRGEIRDMWTYTEDGSLDTEDVVVELDGSGRVIKEAPAVKDNDEKGGAEKDRKTDGNELASTARKEEGPSGESGDADGRDDTPELSADGEVSEGYDVFLFSITAPRQGLAEED
ncbi:hypothetical protein VTK73DRAFT_7571 [Phialemonium thermophilum]|uniref:Signal peptide peptidase n=1 Tax=Phialemonium thermophilum TaxID=223376 RepID=A0ABR3WE26_9PEZI